MRQAARNTNRGGREGFLQMVRRFRVALRVHARSTDDRHGIVIIEQRIFSKNGRLAACRSIKAAIHHSTHFRKPRCLARGSGINVNSLTFRRSGDKYIGILLRVAGHLNYGNVATHIRACTLLWDGWQNLAKHHILRNRQTRLPAWVPSQ